VIAAVNPSKDFPANGTSTPSSDNTENRVATVTQRWSIPSPRRASSSEIGRNTAQEIRSSDGALVDVRSSSFMIGQAVEKAPDLAREIVNRGHEAAAHGGSVANLAGGGIPGIWTPVG
jgi:hypothetical protein